LKIGYDYQIFLVQKYGGISRYFVNLFSSINKYSSDRAAIFAPFHQNVYLSNQTQSKKRNKYLNQIPKRTGIPFSIYNSVKSSFDINKENIEILHQTYYYPMTPFSKAAKILTVFDFVHELFPVPRAVMHSKIKNNAIKKSDHIICISENTKKDLMNFVDIDESKVSVVHLGYEIEDKSIEVEADYNFPYLLYVGNRGGYKNFENYIRAVSLSKKIVNEFKLIFFGGGDFLSYERELIKELNLTENVIWTSGSDATLMSLYSNAEIFVYPSLYEGFGLPPLEAMSNSCPVVCSDSSSIPEVVGEAGRYFDPNDIESISNVIEEVAYNDNLKNDLVALGRENLKRFNWKKTALETLDIYKKFSRF